MNPNREKVFFLVFWLSAACAVGILFGTLALVWYEGHAVLSVRFLTEAWSHADIRAGGVAQAIAGSLYVGIGVALASFPLGIATAVYLTEYAPHSSARRVIQLAIRNLAGVPSVVYGLFGLAVFVSLLSFGTSILSASLTLSAMTLPWIISASVESLEAVPVSFRSSSLALGATHWQTIRRVVLPAALPGCITGGVIGIARALGETAPIIIVGATFYLSGFPASPFDKFMALPYHAFILATQHASPYAHTYAAGTALVLIALTFALSFGAIVLRYRFRKKKDW